MEYEFSRNRTTSYDPQMYDRTSSSSSPSVHPMYGQSLYPRIGQQKQPPIPSIGRHSSYHQASPAAPSPSAAASGLGIRVTIKPEYRISSPPQLTSLGGETPRSNFLFDFDFERRILAEAEKEVPNWSKLGLENLPASMPTPGPGSTSSLCPATDPVLNKYVASGLNREAVSIALDNYGDNPTRVHEFAKAYSRLRDMGFSSNIVAEGLLKYDSDTEKAIAYCLNISS